MVKHWKIRKTIEQTDTVVLNAAMDDIQENRKHSKPLPTFQPTEEENMIGTTLDMIKVYMSNVNLSWQELEVISDLRNELQKVYDNELLVTEVYEDIIDLMQFTSYVRVKNMCLMAIDAINRTIPEEK